MSKDIFDNNIDAMRKWYPDFADAIIQKRNSLDKEFEIDNLISWDGNPIAVIKKGNQELYLQGKRNVNEPIRLWVERLGDIHKYSTVVLAGLGVGTYLNKVVDISDSSVNIIAYEPSAQLFINMLENIDLVSAIESRPIAFVVEDINGNELSPVINKLISTETMEFLKVETHPNYSELYGDKIKDVLEKINKHIDSLMVNYRSGNLFACDLAKNQLENMRYLCDGYNTRQLATAIPHDGAAILVAAGPSLNSNIQYLKRAKNKAFILAVDSALKPLIKAGILPDAYITIDAKKPLNRVDMPEVKELPLIASATANSEILKRQNGKIIMYDDGYALAEMAYFQMGKNLPEVSSGGSVACNGLSLLYKIGFDTIILVGQDLAYTNDKSYADGVEQEKAKKENTQNMIRVKGNYDEEVPTLVNLKIYLEWFVEYIKGIKTRRNVRVINATAGGAYIEGTELMSLEDAIEECCREEVNYEQLLAQMEPDITKQERTKMVEYLHSIPDDLLTIKKNAQILHREYKKVYNQGKSGHIDSKSYLNSLKKIKKYTKKCDGMIAYQLVTSSMPAAEFVVRSESLYENDTIEEEAVAIGKQGMNFSKMIQECATIINEYAKETLLNIE